MSKIHVEQWDEQQFLKAEVAWQQLLAESQADPLFMSWCWQYFWWSAWGKKPGFELVLLAFFQENELIGIVPLYQHRIDKTKFGHCSRIEFIGNCWRQEQTVRTEYVGPIVKRGYEQTVWKQLIVWLRKHIDWDEFVICDIETEKYQEFGSHVPWYYKRYVDRNVATRIDTRGEYRAYLAGLGKNTRLKLYNRRKYLADAGKKVEMISAEENEIEHYFSTMNQLHEQRWGKPALSATAFQFHQQVAGYFFKKGGLGLTALSIDGKFLSLLYNLKVGACVYNLKSAFSETFDSKVSLGTLHLGYALEGMFADEQVDKLDLLIGIGKNIDYKERVGNARVDVGTLQIIKPAMRQLLYRCYDRIYHQ